MSLLFRSGSVPFDPTKGKTQSEVGSVAFPHDVKRAEVCLAGFDIQYDNGDHHVLRQIIDAKIERIEFGTVYFRVQFLLRDSSGNTDDPFSGIVYVLVIADVPSPQRQLTTQAGVTAQ
ncbi:MAG TPA: hypothetical protein VKB05_18060 [Pyrinomonadaceae bacterium]|nr:hypothetical protein [Pyrinomonadaceae bacterium]